MGAPEVSRRPRISALPTFNSRIHNPITGRSFEGFTLLEILLVIVIIGVIAGVATLSMGDQRLHSLKSEGKKLQATLNWLSEEAVFQQRPYGLEILEQGYQKLVWDYLTEKWLVADDKKAVVYLPDYITIKPQRKRQERERFGNIDPHPVASIIFFPDQDFESFELRLQVKGSDHWLTIRGQRFEGMEIVY